MAGIFDTGIFDTGIFDAGISSPSVGTFDTGIFDRNIYDNVLGPVASQTEQRLGGGGGAPIWPGALEAFFKKKPKKQSIARELAQVIEQTSPELSEADSEAIARRILEQTTYRQLQQIATLEAFMARVEAEMAEMDDEEVLLLAA